MPIMNAAHIDTVLQPAQIATIPTRAPLMVVNNDHWLCI